MTISDNDEYEQITTNELKIYEWSSLIKEWAVVTDKYVYLTEKLAKMMSRHFPTEQSFNNNSTIIKRTILEGLSDNEKEIIRLTNEIKYSKKHKLSDEDKEMKNKRQQVLKKVFYYYVYYDTFL